MITNPLPLASHITKGTQLFGSMENSPTEFSVDSPTWTNTFGFLHSVEVRTDAKSESGLVDGFLRMNISPGRDPYSVFTSFLVLRLVSGLLEIIQIHVYAKRQTSDSSLEFLRI